MDLDGIAFSESYGGGLNEIVSLECRGKGGREEVRSVKLLSVDRDRNAGRGGQVKNGAE